MSHAKATQKNQASGASHENQIKRLNRISGQVNGIIKMVEDERYCIDIVNQIKAIKSALATVERNIIEDHLNHCIHKALDSGNKRQASAMVEEIKDLLKSSR